MEKKLSFNENADNYDRLRLRYCQELFADIAAYIDERYVDAHTDHRRERLRRVGVVKNQMPSCKRVRRHWRWVQGQGRLPDPFWRGAVR